MIESRHVGKRAPEVPKPGEKHVPVYYKPF